MGENLFPFFLEGAFLRDSQNNGCATTAERAIGGGSQSVEWKPAVCATSCIHDSSKKLRGVGGGGGSNRKAGLGRNLFQIRASGSPRTRRKTRRFFFFLLLRVLDPVLFQCQSHDFPINLSLVLGFFFFFPFFFQSSAPRLELNSRWNRNVVWNVSPPRSYFCCLSVRPNCLFPNNVPLFSEPTLGDFSPITLFPSRRRSTFQTCQARTEERCGRVWPKKSKPNAWR